MLQSQKKKLLTELNVSRTPVREAFLQLAHDQLLEVRPQRGSFVTLIDLDQVEDARFIREQLEVGIVRLACSTFSEDDQQKMETNLILQEQMMKNQKYDELFKLDGEFHRLIASSCGKVKVAEMIQHMNVHFDRLRMLSLSSNLNWEAIYNHHQNILKAIVNQNEDQAEQVMKEHLSLITVDQVALKKQFPIYFK